MTIELLNKRLVIEYCYKEIPWQWNHKRVNEVVAYRLKKRLVLRLENII